MVLTTEVDTLETSAQDSEGDSPTFRFEEVEEHGEQNVVVERASR